MIVPLQRQLGTSMRIFVSCSMFRSSIGTQSEIGETSALAVGGGEKTTGSKRSRGNVPLNGLIL
jgi:hypothetical protein